MPLFSGATKSELPSWLADLFEGVAARGEQLAAVDNPETYKGQRLADLPVEMMQARNLSTLGTGKYKPYLEKASNLASRGSSPFIDSYQQYMNPYQREVVNRIAEEGNRNLNENILPALEAKFVRLGQHGGSRHADLSRRAARDVQSDISANQARALAQGYQQAAQIYNADRARDLESSNALASLGGLQQAGNLTDIAMLMEQGKYQQAQDQASKDIAYQDFLRKQNYPWEMLQNLSGILHGIPQQPTQTQFYQTPNPATMNMSGQIGSTAAQLWGALRSRGQ